MRQFDYSVLDQPMTFQIFWDEVRRSMTYRILGVGIIVISVIILLAGILARNLIVPVFFLPFIAMFSWKLTASIKKSILLKRFSAANGLAYLDDSSPINETGVIFNTGWNQGFSDGFVDGATGWLLANYRYTNDKNQDSQLYEFGVMRLVLPRNMPHVLLDSKKNNFVGHMLPTNFAAGQNLQLEGNFNDYFSVYVPEGYQRDALYFLTPELMAILVDQGSTYDFEIIDNKLYIYTKVFDFTKNGLQTTLQQWTAWAQYFGKEFGQNIQRYADERVAGSEALNTVSIEGQRLKKGQAWKWIVGGILFAAAYIAAFFVYAAV